MRVGFVINPIAGMGGKVGLKGTDNVVNEAIKLGAKPSSPQRALSALNSLPHNHPLSELLVYGSIMGADVAIQAGLTPNIIGQPLNETTSSEDTKKAIRSFVDANVDLILFSGGDGTAVDISLTLDELKSNIPILGIPAGVKIYSSVFARTPQDIGPIISSFSVTESHEVMDLDEDAYRSGNFSPRLHSIRLVPLAEELQTSKQIVSGSVDGAIESLISEFSPDTTYILGPGATLHKLKQKIGFNGTPLGVDIWRTKKVQDLSKTSPISGTLIGEDANESKILSCLTKVNVVIVSPIGGQGFIFGRGNGQISPTVLENCTIQLIGSQNKLDSLDVLRVDTGDLNMDLKLRGWMRVHTGRFQTRMIEVV